MTKLKLIALSALALAAVAPVAQAYTINFAAGDLRNNAGTLMPVGGLLQLVADTSRNGFTLPTTGSFTSGDDLIIASFALNGNLTGNGVAGQTFNPLTITPANFAGLDAGDPLIFRWYPSLTQASTVPGTGTMYGQFRATVNQDGSDLAPTPWASPNEPGSYSLSFITVSQGGSNANSLGLASSTVAVPEPSTWAMLAGGLGGLTFLGLRRRQQAA